MYAPFSALHPTPSHLTSTTSTTETAITESMDASASTSAVDEEVEVANESKEGEFCEDDYVNVSGDGKLNAVYIQLQVVLFG